MYTQNINLSVIPSGVRPVIPCSQYDNQLQALRFTLYKEGASFTIPNNAAVIINGYKPDNTAFSYAATAISGNVVTFAVTQQMTAVAGDVVCELRVRTEGEIIGTLNFILRVEPAPLQDDTVLSETDIPLIEQAIDIAANLAEYIQATYDNAEAAEASANAAAASATAATTDAASAASDAASVQELYDSIETAKTNANTAAAAANAAAANLSGITAEAESLEYDEAATAEYNAANKKFTFGIPAGVPGAPGIGVPTSGVFWMYVDAKSDLYVVYNDPARPPKFRYDPSTGALYYIVGADRNTVSGEPPLTITDAEAGDAVEVIGFYAITQSGSGTPAPDNVRNFVGLEDFSFSDGEHYHFFRPLRTMYAGQCDMTTGIITYTHDKITFDGSVDEAWESYVNASDNTIFRTTITDSYSDLFSLDSACDRLVRNATLAENYTFRMSNKRVNIRVDGITTVADFRAWLASNPLTFCYKLATPGEKTVTPTAFPLTDGTNTVYTNMTTLSVEYVQREGD